MSGLRVLFYLKHYMLRNEPNTVSDLVELLNHITLR